MGLPEKDYVTPEEIQEQGMKFIRDLLNSRDRVTIKDPNNKPLTILPEETLDSILERLEELEEAKELSQHYSHRIDLPKDQWVKDTLAREILQDLIDKGLSGEELVSEFDKLYSKTKTSIDSFAETAKEIAKSDDHKDDMNEVFGDL